MKRSDWLAGLALAVAVAGVLAAAVLFVSFVLDSGAPLIPECAAKKAGGRCALCGMSRSFIALSHGRITEAFVWNPAGPWVYAGFVLLSAAGAMAGKYTTSEYLRKSAYAGTLP